MAATLNEPLRARAGRRVPGHRPGAVGDLRDDVHRQPGHGRRPEAGHLPVPRGGRAGLPGGHRRRRHGAPRHQLPQRRPPGAGHERADPRRAPGRPAHRRRGGRGRAARCGTVAAARCAARGPPCPRRPRAVQPARLLLAAGRAAASSRISSARWWSCSPCTRSARVPTPARCGRATSPCSCRRTPTRRRSCAGWTGRVSRRYGRGPGPCWRRRPRTSGRCSSPPSSGRRTRRRSAPPASAPSSTARPRSWTRGPPARSCTWRWCNASARRGPRCSPRARSSPGTTACVRTASSSRRSSPHPAASGNSPTWTTWPSCWPRSSPATAPRPPRRGAPWSASAPRWSRVGRSTPRCAASTATRRRCRSPRCTAARGSSTRWCCSRSAGRSPTAVRPPSTTTTTRGCGPWTSPRTRVGTARTCTPWNAAASTMPRSASAATVSGCSTSASPAPNNAPSSGGRRPRRPSAAH